MLAFICAEDSDLSPHNFCHYNIYYAFAKREKQNLETFVPSLLGINIFNRFGISSWGSINKDVHFVNFINFVI